VNTDLLGEAMVLAPILLVVPVGYYLRNIFQQDDESDEYLESSSSQIRTDTDCSTDEESSEDALADPIPSDKRLILGPMIEEDETPQKNSPKGSIIPENLQNSVTFELPVGFRRLRRGMLKSDSKFWEKVVLRESLKYRKVKKGNWDTNNDLIGQPTTQPQINQSIIGSKRELSFHVPKSGIAPESTAYETATITEYNNNFFVLKRVILNPDIPFGNKIVTHSQIVVIDNGYNRCQMICSSEVEFPTGPPTGLGWQIKKGVKTNTMKTFGIMDRAIRESSAHDEKILFRLEEEEYHNKKKIPLYDLSGKSPTQKEGKKKQLSPKAANKSPRRGKNNDKVCNIGDMDIINRGEESKQQEEEKENDTIPKIYPQTMPNIIFSPESDVDDQTNCSLLTFDTNPSVESVKKGRGKWFHSKSERGARGYRRRLKKTITMISESDSDWNDSKQEDGHSSLASSSNKEGVVDLGKKK
jgi:hypothetical protein